jgi:hypothetical protein
MESRLELVSCASDGVGVRCSGAAKGRYLYLASLQMLFADWIGCRFGSCWALKRAIDCLVARSKTALWEEPTLVYKNLIFKSIPMNDIFHRLTFKPK